MLIEFEDEELRRLYEDPNFMLPRLGRDLTRAFRKIVTLIVSANDERDLAAIRSVRFEKLKGVRTGQWSLRLNQQWRLIIRFVRRKEGKVLVVVEVVDYH
jgi:proteic killer suppression protein